MKRGRTPQKAAAIDLMLEVIHMVTQEYCPGYCWTFEDLAELCEVRHSALVHTEQRALRKLRNRALFSDAPFWQELRDSIGVKAHERKL